MMLRGADERTRCDRHRVVALLSTQQAGGMGVEQFVDIDQLEWLTRHIDEVQIPVHRVPAPTLVGP